MKNDAVLSKGKAAGGMTPKNTNMHKLNKLGKNPKFEVSGGKKTPA